MIMSLLTLNWHFFSPSFSCSMWNVVMSNTRQICSKLWAKRKISWTSTVKIPWVDPHLSFPSRTKAWKWCSFSWNKAYKSRLDLNNNLVHRTFVNHSLEIRSVCNSFLFYPTQDALLVAIREDYVDGVDCLLVWEEEHHKEGTLYSWEQTDQVTANFSPDMTPLTLAGETT